MGRRRCARRSSACFRSPAARSVSWARSSSAARRPRSRASGLATCRRAGACGRRSRSTSTCGLPPATAARNGPSRASTKRSRGWRSGAPIAATSSPAASSRCWRLPAAFLLNPRLLIMDEPTEGLAPVIVERVEEILVNLGEQGDIGVLVVEQNIGVATAVAEKVAIMINGRVNRVMDAARLEADRELQQRLLGRRPAWRSRAAGRSRRKRPVPKPVRKAKASAPRGHAAQSGFTCQIRRRRPAGRSRYPPPKSKPLRARARLAPEPADQRQRRRQSNCDRSTAPARRR